MTFYTVPNIFTPDTIARSALVNANFSTAAGVINGNLDTTNLSAGANIKPSQLNLTLAFLDLLVASGALAFGAGQTGDTIARAGLYSDGSIRFGPGGSTAADTELERTGTSILQLNNAAGGPATFDMNGGTIINTTFAGSATTIVGSGNPNGAQAGVVGEQYFDSTNIVNYICTTAGTSSTAVWTRTSIPAGSIQPWWSVNPVPPGWLLCNGVTVGGVTPPNLIGMLIQGADITGGSSAPNSNGYGSQANQSNFGVVSNNLAHTHTITSTLNVNTITINAGTLAPVLDTSTTITSGSGSALGVVSTQPAVLSIVYIYKL
jgi:hypothetical protein